MSIKIIRILFLLIIFTQIPNLLFMDSVFHVVFNDYFLINLFDIIGLFTFLLLIMFGKIIFNKNFLNFALFVLIVVSITSLSVILYSGKMEYFSDYIVSTLFFVYPLFLWAAIPKNRKTIFILKNILRLVLFYYSLQQIVLSVFLNIFRYKFPTLFGNSSLLSYGSFEFFARVPTTFGLTSGGQAIFYALFSYYKLIKMDVKNNYLDFILIFLTIISLFLNLSRSVILADILFIVFLLFENRKNYVIFKKQVINKIIFLTIVIILLVTIFFPTIEKIFDIFKLRFFSETTAVSDFSRMEKIDRGLTFFEKRNDSYLFGNSFGSYYGRFFLSGSKVFFGLQSQSLKGEKNYFAPHNMYVMLAIELGLLGSGILLFGFLLFIFSGSKEKKYAVFIVIVTFFIFFNTETATFTFISKNIYFYMSLWVLRDIKMENDKYKREPY